MSTFFNDTHIQQVLQATSIIEVVGNYVALKPRGKEHVGVCPFHDDSRPSMNVNPGKQIFKCFACGAGGDVIKFMMLREKMSFPEAVKFLADRAGIALPERNMDGPSEDFSRTDLEAVNRWAARTFRKWHDDAVVGQRARDYIAGRQIQVDVARRFGLGWAPPGWDHLVKVAHQDGISVDALVRLGLVVKKDDGSIYDRFRERVIFPVIDAVGRVIAFGGRTLADDPAKYLNSPESPLFDKSQALYGIHAAKDAIIKTHTVIVVEGYTDCLMAHQFGIANVVATLGTALTDQHARVISRYADRIVLVFDSDAAGQKAADRAIEILFGRRMDVRLATVPEGKDPCDFLLLKGTEAFNQLAENAIEALEYKWRLTRQRLESQDTVGGFQRATEEFLQVVAKAFSSGQVDAITRGFLVNHVAQMVGQPTETINALLCQQQQTRPVRYAAAEAVGAAGEAVDSVPDAYRQVLEVLLNRPEDFARVCEVIADPDEFGDPTYQAIARRLWVHYQQGAAGGLAGIVASCEDTDLCSTIIGFAERGETRGNLDATLEGALARIRDSRMERRRSDIRRDLVVAADKYGADVEATLLKELCARIKPDLRRPGAR